MFESNEVRKVMFEDVTVWERFDMMPKLANITGYFDHRRGYTSQGWENQAEGYPDVEFTGSVTKPSNYIHVPPDASAKWMSGRMPNAFTIYLIARAEKTSTWYSGFGQFLLSGITTNYGMQGIEISTGWDERSRPAFRSQNGQNVGTKVPGNEFHVLAVSVTGGTGRCFVDGALWSSSLSYSSNALDHLWLGKRESFSSRYANDYQFFAFAPSAHSDSDVIENSTWLVEQFGVPSMRSHDVLAFPGYLTASGTQFIDTGYVQQSSAIWAKWNARINSAPSGEVGMLSAGNNFMFAYDVGDSSHPLVYWRGGEQVVSLPADQITYNSKKLYFISASPSDTQIGGGGTYPHGTAVDVSTLTQGSYQILANGFSGRLYDACLADNEVIVRDFLPARRYSDYKAGYFDFVTHGFFMSAGATDFGYGG